MLCIFLIVIIRRLNITNKIVAHQHLTDILPCSLLHFVNFAARVFNCTNEEIRNAARREIDPARSGK
jgi:hypothetical protein